MSGPVQPVLSGCFLRLPQMNQRVRILQTSVAALLALAPATLTQAQNTWTGSVDASWDTVGNWSAAAEPIATDAVLFPGIIPATGPTITLTAGELAGTLAFSNSYTLTGGDLTLGTGTITVDDTFTATINSILAGTTVSKAGLGTLVLTGANTYTGVTTVNAGVLNIRNAAGLGTVAGGTTVAAGAALELQGGFAVGAETLGLTGTLRSVSGSNTWGGIITLNAGSAFDIASGSTLTVSASSVGTGAWTKSGAGTLIFTADPNQTGPLTIADGVVELNHTGATDFSTTIQTGATLRTLTGSVGDGTTVTVDAGGTYDIRASDTISRLLGAGLVTKGTAGAVTLTISSTTAGAFSGVIQDGAGQIVLSKGGANTVTFSGTNTYTGNTSIATGSIIVSGPTARLSGGTASTVVTVGDNNGNDESLILGSSTDVIAGTLDRFADLATLRFSGAVPVTYNGAAAGGATNETAGALDFATGSGILSLVPAAGGEVQVSFASLTRLNNNATGVIRGTGLAGAAGTADSSRVLFATAPATVGLGGTGSSSSIIPFLIGGASATAAPDTFLRYDATNGVTPLGASDYAATIAGSTGQNVSISGAETVIADSTINALRVTAGGAATLNADTLIRSGAVLFTADGAIGGSGKLILGEGARQGVIQASGDTTVTGTIGANIVAVSGLVIGDAGTAPHVILLSGDNLISGGIVVNNGILRLGSAGALNDMFPNDLVLRAGSNGVTAATTTALQLNGQDATVLFNGNDRLQGSTRIQNASATPATLTIVTNVASTGNDGVMENGIGGGALSFVKRGAATLGLEQNNTFTGTTDVAGGTLQLTTANGRLTGTSAVTIRNNAVLNLNNTNTANQTDRLGNVPINMQGGVFQFDNNQNTVNYSETTGALNVLNGNNTVTTDFAASGQTSTLTFASLAVSPGAAVNFQGFNTSGDVAIGEGVNRNRLVFTAAPTLTTGGIIGGSVYHTKDFNTATTQDVIHFATYGDVDPTAATALSIFAFAGYNTGADTGWTTTTVANPAADIVLTGNRTLEALRLGGGIDVDVVAGQTLNLSTGGLLHNGASSTVYNVTLTAGGATAGEFAIRVEDNLTTSTLTISSVIADNGGAVSLL
jgi:autotransporter-associated beta strand protein